MGENDTVGCTPAPRGAARREGAVRFDRLFRLGGRVAAEEIAAPRRVGLVLGGGVVRGAAHVGVFSVFEREGIRADVVAGTSVGALVGAGVAAGVSAAEMYEHFRSARWRDLARPSWGSKRGILDTGPMGELVERVCRASTFADLELPFAAVACDIRSGGTFVFTDGPLREALVASSAIPGLFEPVERDGMLLVDGGVTDVLPVDAARGLGATVTIGVDIMPPPHGGHDPRDVRDMLLVSWDIMTRLAAAGCELPDLAIRPDVGGVSFSDFSQVPVAYEAGVRAAEEALPELARVLG